MVPSRGLVIIYVALKLNILALHLGLLKVFLNWYCLKTPQMSAVDDLECIVYV